VEKRVDGGVDATLLGANVDDQPAEEPEPSSFGGSQVRTRKRVAPKARPLVVSSSPRQTRARSRLNPVDSPQTTPAAPRAITRAKEAAVAAASATTSLEHITESQVVDEFKAHSDDEGDMHEVEADLQINTESRGVSQITPASSDKAALAALGNSSANARADNLSADDLQTLQRLQGAPLHTPVAADFGDDQDDGDSDAELLAHVRKLDVRVRRLPTTNGNRGDKVDDGSTKEIFPSRGTRAASMIQKESARKIARHRS
jgi:hypothetical protein